MSKVNPMAGMIVDAIFAGRESIVIMGKRFYKDKSIWRNKNITGFRLPDPKDPSENYLWIEQNPKTNSFYAKMTQRGAKIVWVIHSKKGYIALIIDGCMHRREPGKGWVSWKGIY